jgi:hypothetical protein
VLGLLMRQPFAGEFGCVLIVFSLDYLFKTWMIFSARSLYQTLCSSPTCSILFFIPELVLSA